eukprot:TRINITY_DN7852_c0_g1_i2.p1 TRINITY_DN7852_c0_g1~~TRINITY_DN7852_c0_g1_i2.p1  ORF type:complete len:657 (+),score=136.79 TRINITY_DN7852_c0_g1_i2:117-1973(+)
MEGTAHLSRTDPTQSNASFRMLNGKKLPVSSDMRLSGNRGPEVADLGARNSFRSSGDSAAFLSNRDQRGGLSSSGNTLSSSNENVNVFQRADDFIGFHSSSEFSNDDLNVKDANELDDELYVDSDSSKDEDYTESKFKPNSFQRAISPRSSEKQLYPSESATFSNPPAQITTQSRNRRSQSRKKQRICEFCSATETPMWRRGPQGKGTLCNACGVKWSLKSRKRQKKGNGKMDQQDESDEASLRATTQYPPIQDFRTSGIYQAPFYRQIGSPGLSIDLDCLARFHIDASPPLTPSIGSPNPSSYPSSPPFGLSSEIPPSLSFAYKDACCRFCNTAAVTFRTVQEFGTHCATCSGSERTPNSSFGKESSLEREYFAEQRDRRRRELESLKKWDSEDGFDSSAHKLLSHLLAVVKDRVLEEQELDQIKRELASIRYKIDEEAALQKAHIERYGRQNTEELANFRREIVDFVNAQDSQSNGRLLQIGKEAIASIREGAQNLYRDLEMIGSNMKTSQAMSLEKALEKIQNLERHVMDVNSKLESSCAAVERHSNDAMKKMEHHVILKLDDKTKLVSMEIDELKRRAAKGSGIHLAQIGQMEIAIGSDKVPKTQNVTATTNPL